MSTEYHSHNNKFYLCCQFSNMKLRLVRPKSPAVTWHKQPSEQTDRHKTEKDGKRKQLFSNCLTPEVTQTILKTHKCRPLVVALKDGE